jgi:hypothetical protein
MCKECCAFLNGKLLGNMFYVSDVQSSCFETFFVCNSPELWVCWVQRSVLTMRTIDIVTFGMYLNCMHIIHLLSSAHCGLCSDMKFVVYFFLKKKCRLMKSAFCLWSTALHFRFEPNERFYEIWCEPYVIQCHSV